MDPLRAGHVAVLGGRFRYFCRAECKQTFLHANGRPIEDDVATQRPPEVSAAPAEARLQLPSAPPVDDAPAAVRTDPPPPASRVGPVSAARPTLPSPEAGVAAAPAPSPAPAPEPAPAPAAVPAPSRDRTIPAIDAAGIALGALAPTLGLLGTAAEVARLPLVVASWAALATRILLARREPSDPHALVTLAPATGAVAAACWAAAVGDAHAASIAVLGGLACSVAIGADVLVDRMRARVLDAGEAQTAALVVPARVVRGDHQAMVAIDDVRPGETVVVEPGERVPVDGVVAAGEGRVVPWLDARVEVVKRAGDPVVAGARAVSSRLRLTTTWSGRDRAWIKLLATPSRRIDVASPTPRALRLGVERGAPVAAMLVALAAFAANAPAVQVLAAFCAGAVAFGTRATVSFVALHFLRAHLEALRHGIAYKDARSFERAGAANLAVLSARGTVLSGEPEIVALEPLGAFDLEQVLALAAGAESASSHPLAAAVVRAARSRGVPLDAVRNATVHPGLGVTATSSGGERLVVGGRAIMLESKVGVASADGRISELEALGRSVLVVALGDRLVGLIALIDGLRPGARAAVQQLLDARIEPVLVSGEARDTCETIARALDIEHVRPEVLPADRGAEVRALAEGGSVVAVIGHAAPDDGPLGAADVAVAIGAAGATPGEWAVALASDDLRDAASALTIPHAARARARAAILLGSTPCVAALLAIAFGVAPPAVAPLAVLVGVLALAAHAREPPSA